MTGCDELFPIILLCHQARDGIAFFLFRPLLETGPALDFGVELDFCFVDWLWFLFRSPLLWQC